MPRPLLILCSIGLIGCSTNKDIAQQFKLLDEVHLSKNTYYISSANNRVYFKINTGYQDIIFAMDETDASNIQLDDMKSARCFAIHYAGAACDEGNFRVKGGTIKFDARDDGLEIDLNIVSVKSNVGLKTEKDLKALFKTHSDHECTWTYKAKMRASLHPSR